MFTMWNILQKKGQTGTRDRIAWEDEESTSFISPKATGKLKIPPAVESLVDNESTDENHDDNVVVNLTKEKVLNNIRFNVLMHFNIGLYL